MWLDWLVFYDYDFCPSVLWCPLSAPTILLGFLWPWTWGISSRRDIARRHKKAFLSDHCKEIEENNRIGKTRDLFKKIRDTKGTFHAKMGSIKDRNGMDLTEAEDIKKRWQEYPEELYKKDLHDPDNHDGVITHLEPDILECEVKWVLGSITTNKASGGDGIPVELFSNPERWCCESAPLNMPANLENYCWVFKLPHNCTHLTR